MLIEKESDMRFENQVAVVTGAASGIGHALVRQLAAEGAAVVAVDIAEAPLQKVVEELRAAGGKATACLTNVADDAEVERMLETALSTYGRLDVLCNNAGIMDRMIPTADLPLDLWNRVLAVNLTGPMLACRRAIPIMLTHGGGAIVNTASEAGLRGGAAGTAYTVSKHGVVGLTRSVAFHYGDQGIRCNAVCPGGVETAIGVGGAPHQAGLAKVMAFVQGSGGGAVAKPEQIAAVIAFLASPDASNVNGAIVPVDHGWAAA
jgi:NAD(P)-dependent dehydrogenase (short-subunit alcohol dehydrogenase family)